MRTAVRIALAALAVFGIAMAGTGSVRAADPTIGGQLSAGDHRVILVSQGTAPVMVKMSAEVVTLSETTFPLAPGETHKLTYSGDHVGAITATLTGLAQGTVGEVGSLTLGVNLRDYTPPPDYSVVGLLILLIAGAGLVLRRIRPWELRIHRG